MTCEANGDWDTVRSEPLAAERASGQADELGGASEEKAKGGGG